MFTQNGISYLFVVSLGVFFEHSLFTFLEKLQKKDILYSACISFP